MFLTCCKILLMLKQLLSTKKNLILRTKSIEIGFKVYFSSIVSVMQQFFFKDRLERGYLKIKKFTTKNMKRAVPIEVKYLQKDEINYISIRFILQNMIGLNNKNYSFIAISKHSKSKQTSADASLYKIFSPKNTHYHKNKGKDENLTYASPSSQQINGYRYNLSFYVHRKSYQGNKLIKNNDKKSIFSLTQFFKSDNLSRNRSSAKWHTKGTEKRKNIREYMAQVSKEKRKFSENKPTQNNSSIKQEQKQKCNPVVIVKNLKRSKDERKYTINVPFSIFKQRVGPIHDTKRYYFSKEKANTQPIETIIKKKEEQKQKKQVTITRSFKMRQQINFKQAQKITQKANNELLLINQIHPTIAIITNRKKVRKNSPKSSLGEKQQIITSKIEINRKIKLKQEEQISPWKRKNQHEFQLF